MATEYQVLVKNTATEDVTVAGTFVTYAAAVIWVEEQMEIWYEDRAYKIVEA